MFSVSRVLLNKDILKNCDFASLYSRYEVESECHPPFPKLSNKYTHTTHPAWLRLERQTLSTFLETAPNYHLGKYAHVGMLVCTLQVQLC